jgi:dipeptidyl aminopeptidase/acylaminoacyl peptidase
MLLVLFRLIPLGLALSIFTSTAAGQAALPAAPARVPMEAFFAWPALGSMTLSPDGKLLAAKVMRPDRRMELQVIELDTKRIHMVASFVDGTVGTVDWVNNRRLLYSLAGGQGLIAVNFDGSERVVLAGRRDSPLWSGATVRAPGAPGSDDMYLLRNRKSEPLALVNTLSSTITPIALPDETKSWLIDERGVLRLYMTDTDGNWAAFYRPDATTAWRALGAPAVQVLRSNRILGLGPDDSVYVLGANGQDKKAVYTLDLTSGKLPAMPLISMANYDFNGVLIQNQDGLLGFRAVTDAVSTIWIDPVMKALQAEVDQRQPATVNLITPPKRAASPWVLVESYSDRQPTVVTVYNTQTHAFTKVGEVLPGIRAAQMGRQEIVHYKARDGREIEAILTMPPMNEGGPAPMVVMVHGGPFVRGKVWGWNGETQFLATRGYAVLEPAFRGTSGFGKAHLEAGYKQWGLAMQDDVTDGTRWAIAQGYADPKRICIAGGSYGGYATLMGLIKELDLYRCGIDWVGVTDIALLYEEHWGYRSDATDEVLKYTYPMTAGDPVKDAAQLAATSPLRRAADLHQPLLMAYGMRDQRVPLFHGIKFRDAVRKTNAQVEWVQYEDEGHGWHLEKTQTDFWIRVEKFLDKHIGTP